MSTASYQTWPTVVGKETGCGGGFGGRKKRRCDWKQAFVLYPEPHGRWVGPRFNASNPPLGRHPAPGRRKDHDGDWSNPG